MKFPFYFFILQLLVFCAWGNSDPGHKRQNIALEIKPTFRGNDLHLQTTFYKTANGDTVSISRFRFYISAIKIAFENGATYQEQNSYHLIDAEDPLSLIIPLTDVPDEKVATITFHVGIDSTESVSGAMGGALDPVKGMYWAWNSGYINAKLEGVCKSKQKNHPFEFHVGGYLHPYYALRTVSIPVNRTNNKISIEADAAEWLLNMDLHKENSIVIPGREAMLMADKYVKMFRVIN
ncbi:MAG: hypothetical protein K0R26_2240 [Bacteroidota bacterium]|jgi:hypothetical protein|nr:hypothetical protein [Bacteroidota bacterium]